MVLIVNFYSRYDRRGILGLHFTPCRAGRVFADQD